MPMLPSLDLFFPNTPIAVAAELGRFEPRYRYGQLFVRCVRHGSNRRHTKRSLSGE
jgi:hypothetical protein